MLNQHMRILIALLVLIGFILSLIIFVSLFYTPIQVNTDDFQDDIIPQHYNLEFIDHFDYLNCHTEIFFQLTQDRYQIIIIKPIDHNVQISSIKFYDKETTIPIEIQIKTNEIILQRRQSRKNKFYSGNYSISIHSHTSISNTINTNFIQEIWSPNYRILFTNNNIFPYLSHSFYRSILKLNVISSDYIISNLPLNQTSSLFQISQIAFALLRQYECRSMDILQLCLPINSLYEIDLFSYIFNYTLNTIRIFESYFSRRFPLDKLTFIAVLELNHRFISKPGLVFIDQNALLTNTSAEQIIQQHSLIYLILAYQWSSMLIQFDKDTQWFAQSLTKSIASYLLYKNNDFLGNNNSQIEHFMSTVVIDSLCTEIKSENNLIEQGEAFLTEYRLNLGDNQFYSRIQQLIQYSNNALLNQSMLSSILTKPNHTVIVFNSSTIDMHLFKFNSNCSSSISSMSSIIYYLLNDSSISNSEIVPNSLSVLIPFNAFIHILYPSWNHLIDEIKHIRYQQLSSLSKLIFDSFLFNLANQISIKYPLQLINLFFQQPIAALTKSDLFVINKILQWYRSMLSHTIEEKFLIYLRKILHPFCLNHLWTRQILTDMRYINQQILNDLLLELCCSINHSICLQQISNRNDPQTLIQSILNNQRYDLLPTKQVVHKNQTDMLTSYNQLQIPSLFIYPDRIIVNVICQTVRQQNDKYWYDLIHYIQQKFQSHPIPLSITIGLACAIQTIEQVEFYLNNLCPSSPFKWPCYRNILTYSTIKNFQQLKTIDNEQWPINNDEIVDFLFHTSNSKQENFSSQAFILEFQALTYTWLTNNQYDFLHWLDNENNQNAYLI